MKKYHWKIAYIAEILDFLEKNACKWFTARKVQEAIKERLFRKVKGALEVLVLIDLITVKRGSIDRRILVAWIMLLGVILLLPFSLGVKLGMLGLWGIMTWLGRDYEIGMNPPNRYSFCKDDEGNGTGGKGEVREERIKRKLEERLGCEGFFDRV